ncbi:MAG TPA: serine protease [Porphyromonadaceae bacterium]|nr:serine protease [Porphyromonadaceae bacterium]
MLINKYYKLLFLYVFVFFCILQTSTAQEATPVVFEDYSHLAEDILRLLKQDGRISSFTGMSELKNKTKDVEESKRVPVKIQKGKKRSLHAAKMIHETKKGVLMVCKYIPALQRNERVAIGATAIVLSEDGVCATNCHVLQQLIDKNYSLTPADSIVFVATSEGEVFPIVSILTYNKTADLALFQIDCGNKPLTPVPLGKDIAVGETVHALTHLEGFPFFYSKGVVARNVTTNPQDPFTNKTEITADFAKGSSGGPILDDSGNLISMVSSTQSIYYTDRPQMDLQMVVKTTIPVSSLQRLIKVIH